MEEITDNDKLLSALAYVFAPLAPIILMLIEEKKERPFIKSHNAQALVIGIIGFILWALSPLGCVTGIIGLGLFIAQLYWAYQAFQGQSVNIPVVSDFVKNQGWA